MIRSYILTAVLAGCTMGAMAQVSVSTKIPTKVSPGSDFNVEMTISKGDVSGFAKLQHELPSGFTATAGETANSTFSFKDRKVKFLWMALPGTSDIVVSYKVKVDAGVSGNQILDGTFSYIRNNETEKYNLPKDIVIVSSDVADGQDVANQRIIEEQRKKAEAAEAARRAAEESEQATATSGSETGGAVADNSGADKAAADRAAADRAAAEKAEADRAKRAENDRAAADREAKAASDRAAKEADRQAKQAQQQAAAPRADATLKSVPGLVFRVQVAAGPNNVDPSIFASKYGIADAISVEEHEGLFKYVVGEFGSYRPAKTFSNELRDNNGVDGPFVTAYNNGVRIHVKEALDIAGQ